MVAIKRMLDLSQELYHLLPGVPQLPAPEFKLHLIGVKDGWTLETVNMTLHTGTHIDSPAHLSPYTQTIDKIPVEQLQGRAAPIALYHKAAGSAIAVADLEPYADRIQPGDIVLLCTGWGQKVAWTEEYIYQSVYLSAEGAEWLAGRGVKGVGIDHFSVGGMVESNKDAHRALLSRGVWIAETLVLPPEICDGAEWHLFCLPMKVRDGSGAQARVVAVEYGG